MAKPVELWTVDEVVAFLQSIDLGDLAPKFREHHVLGEDLLALTESELKADLDITRLQARRIKRHIEDAGSSYQRNTQADEDALPALPNVSGDVPKAEAPDLEDREALAPTLGSFSREGLALGTPAVGMPVGQAEPVFQVDEAVVKRYGETMELIARLEAEQVTVKLPAAREALAQLDRRLQYEDAKYKELLAAQSQQEAKVKELDEGKWYPGKFLQSKEKKAAKVERNQDKAQENERKVAASGAVLEGLHVQRNNMAAHVNDLTNKVQQLRHAKQWEEGILPQVFGGSAGNAQENALEREVDALAPKLQTARQYQASYSQAFELMRAGRKQLQQAQDLFQQSFGLAQANLIGGVLRPGRRDGMLGEMADVAKRVQSQQAARLAQSACDAMIKARTIIPSMPSLQLERVKALRGLNLVGALFDGIAMDIIARQKIQAAMRIIQELMPEAIAAERWLEGWTARVQEDLRATEGEYARKKGELDAVRRGLMQEQVTARARAASAAVPPTLVATVGGAAPAAAAAAPAARPAPPPRPAPTPDLL